MLGSPDGGARAVLLGGDAGMGKTRLLLELTDRAAAAGWRVLVGHCLDLADQLLPYLPFSEMVGRFADEAPDLVEADAALDPARQPALAALAPRRRLLSDDRPRAGLDDLPRSAVLDGVTAFLEAVGAHGPTLVVLEDLHWADQSTRDLVSFLLSRPPRGPVRLVASYRTDDLHRRHPLRTSLAGWARLPAVQPRDPGAASRPRHAGAGPRAGRDRPARAPRRRDRGPRRRERVLRRGAGRRAGRARG